MSNFQPKTTFAGKNPFESPVEVVDRPKNLDRKYPPGRYTADFDRITVTGEALECPKSMLNNVVGCLRFYAKRRGLKGKPKQFSQQGEMTGLVWWIKEE